MGTIYCIGSAVIQLFPRDTDVQFEDILYFKKDLGGGAVVAAWSVACLGGRSAFVGNISSDDFGNYIRHSLKAAGVNLLNAAVSENDTPIMLVKGLKNGKSATVYHNETSFPMPEEKAIHIETSKDDLLHIIPQYAIGQDANSIQVIIDNAGEDKNPLDKYPLSVSLDDWFMHTNQTKEIYFLIKEKINRFDFVFLSEQILDSFEKEMTENTKEKVFSKAAVFILFKKDGSILLYHKQKNIAENKSQSVPLVSTVNRQAVFSGAFLEHCMKNLAVYRGWPQLIDNQKIIREAFHFAITVMALGSGRRSGLLPFPALADVEKIIRGDNEMKNQQEERQRLVETAKQDYYRLKFHVMPEGGWMNDPNGLVQYKGKYHAFYQHYPYAPEWGPMHWGHVISDDLVHWKYLPFALTPDQSYEKGCFSGSAVDNNGELTLIYTAHDDTRSPKEVQCVAFSTDGVNFSKYEHNPVISGPPAEFGEDFRDPKVFMHNNVWYLVAGCTKEKLGGIQLYSSKDLRHWDYRGLACESDGTEGEMWECPDLFKLDDTWVLLTSPMKMKKSKCIFITGKMDFEKAAFTQTQWYNADYGHNFYAPQTFQDEKGRRILLGWMHMWGDETPTKKNGWAGALTFPRELFLKNGEVWQLPVNEIELLRKKKLIEGGLSLKDGAKDNIKNVRGDCLEIKFSIPAVEKRNGKLVLNLRCSENKKEKTVLSYDFDSQRFTFDKRQSGVDRTNVIELPEVPAAGEIPVHIIIDRSSVEIFLYGGKYAVSNRIYPQPSSVFYDVFSEGIDVSIGDFKAWELDS